MPESRRRSVGYQESCAAPSERARDGRRFPPEQMYAAAHLYYIERHSQDLIAQELGTSRATVSRLLAEARNVGIVRIDIQPPPTPAHLAEELRVALRIRAAHVCPPVPPGAPAGALLAAGLREALLTVGLGEGDVLLVSSGRTVYGAVHSDRLPRLPGVVVAPTIGGVDEPAPWFQTNEITRHLAEAVGGRPRFLYAPAVPGAPLQRTLVKDPATRQVLRLWDHARAAIMGVGAPPGTRDPVPTFLAGERDVLGRAVGDISSRFFDLAGDPVPYPGEERLISISREQLAALPASIAVACGADKVAALVAAARARLYSVLVTDVTTARAIIAKVADVGFPEAPSRR